MDILSRISGANAGESQGAMKALNATYRQPTVMETLITRRDSLKDQLDRVDAAIAAMNAHPETQAVLEALSKAL